MELQPLLPKLREDLQIKAQNHSEQGEPLWLLHDPLRNQYFQCNLTTIQLLELWQEGLPVNQLLEQAHTDNIDIEAEELSQVIQFFTRNHLTEASGQQAIEQLTRRSKGAKKGWLSWLIHNYLFIRIPLWKPDRFLGATLSRIEPLFNPQLQRIIQLLGLIGILLVIQQWEAFSHTFNHFFSWQGLGLYALTLMGIKSLHELAHAYSAKRLQCRVPSMGIAFLVLFPVLYTDTTDAWGVTNPRQRLQIVFAGVKMELHLALLATLLWGLLPEGGLKTVAFFIATTSWITSVTVNLNPFMRFDGYFALSDWLQAPNLQPRAFALGRWKLREWLFGFGHPKPETLPQNREQLFIIYAWMTWIYRLFLFLGIALLVYHFTFKVLGILLFLVEIIWFILLPIQKEMAIWWHHREELKMNRATLRTLFLLLTLVTLGLIPWKGTLQIPAVLQATQLHHLYAPEESVIKTLLTAPGAEVSRGEPLLLLHSPTLQSELKQTEIALEQARLARNRQLTRTDDLPVLEQEIQRLQAEQAAIQQRIDQLQITAPISGRLSNHFLLGEQQTVARDQHLFSIRPPHGIKATGFIGQQDLSQIDRGNSATWISNHQPATSLPLKLEQIATSSSRRLPFTELASSQGGPIPSHKDHSRQPIPESSIYQLRFSGEESLPTPQWRESGVIRLEAEAESLFHNLWRTTASLLIEESSF